MYHTIQFYPITKGKIHMKNLLKKIRAHASNPKAILLLRMGFGIGIYALSRSIFAADDSDLLAGTTTQALATINGSGRYWAYIIDGAISLAAFAKTKNPFVFASVLAVALGITVIVKMAGGTA
jgi:hypothetical protein